MGKYGNAALRATKLVQAGTFSSPREAWETAVHKEFPGRHAAQEKGSPRGSYLGICEAGLIVGVDPGSFTNSKDNKGYALEALRLLKMEPALALEKVVLWNRVTQGRKRVDNAQMDVVLTLWENGCIDRGKI